MLIQDLEISRVDKLNLPIEPWNNLRNYSVYQIQLKIDFFYQTSIRQPRQAYIIDLQTYISTRDVAYAKTLMKSKQPTNFHDWFLQLTTENYIKLLQYTFDLWNSLTLLVLSHDDKPSHHHRA